MKALEFLKSVRIDTPCEWKELDKAITEIEELQSRNCSICKHCDMVKNNIIHCTYFENFFPIEIGKCDKYELAIKSYENFE